MTQDFKKQLKEILNENYITKIMKIRGKINEPQKTIQQKQINNLLQTCSDKEKETILRYGHRWGILS